MSPDDKATHKRARANMENLITLACMRIPEFLERVNIDFDLLEPFKGVEIDWHYRNALVRAAQGMPNISQAEINMFMGLAEDVFDYEATKAMAKHPNDSALEHVTEKVLADALWRIAKRECSFLQRKSDATPLAPFMDAKEYPRTTASPYA
jgi:ATP-dependent protease Clp ATPase subunit